MVQVFSTVSLYDQFWENIPRDFIVVEIKIVEKDDDSKQISESFLELYPDKEDMQKVKSFHQALIENDNHPYLKKISNGKLVLNDYSVITGRRLDHAGVVAEFEKMIRVNKSIQTYSLNIYERATKQDLAK